MAKQSIRFAYYPGVYGDAFPFVSAQLGGSWNPHGIFSYNWTFQNMEKVLSEDGGYRYETNVELDDSQTGLTFYWGVQFTNGNVIKWAIPTEINSYNSVEQFRSFVFKGVSSIQKYYLTTDRYLGANKLQKRNGTWGAKFRVWAPNAKRVEVVFGSLWNLDDSQKKLVDPELSIPREKLAGGYIDNNGNGIHPEMPVIQMNRTENGVWETPDDHPNLQDNSLLKHRLYMYKLIRDDDSIVYRSDLYSRCQSGFGRIDPTIENYSGALADLNGRVSCSVTVDPEKVVSNFEVPVWPEPSSMFIDSEQFWSDEFNNKMVPRRVEDLIIYELHLGALGYGKTGPGTLKDAKGLLDYIENLNVNAIELLPLSEFAGEAYNWGYATSHYFAIEYSGGGRDQFKHFVKECHRRGLAVIMDVVYNHYDHFADRAQRYFDSPMPEKDIYYWYEGNSEDYRHLANTSWGASWNRGGYIENGSTGDAPAYHQEMVRKLFISSAVSLIKDFHIDGFRVDQTTCIHRDNKVSGTGQQAGNVNFFGAKFLREFGRTLRLFKPDIMLLAEDHSEWDQVITPVENGGMGFDAKWFSEYYHSLVGDTEKHEEANLLRAASILPSEAALNMSKFSNRLWHSKYHMIVYNESHDEAGNSKGPFPDLNWTDHGKRETSHRTIVVAVNNAPLFGNTRKFAEARCRFAWGVTVLSAGTPMFLFGEEVGAEKRFKYNTVTTSKEDLDSMKNTYGQKLYRFYSDINALRLNNPGLRSRNIDIVHVNDGNRVIVFRRWNDNQSFLIFASLSDYPYVKGYSVYNDRVEQGTWREVFNSDADIYGGDNIGNQGESIKCQNSFINAVIPFSGFVVFKHE